MPFIVEILSTETGWFSAAAFLRRPVAVHNAAYLYSIVYK